jgi:hypothetical protein
METETKQEKKIEKNLGWLKGLLNNLPLLKWVRKYTADNLLEDNKLADKWGIKTTDETISIGDKGMTKLLITNSRYSGTEHIRFNAKHLYEVLKDISSEGELIISKGNDKVDPEMFIQVKDMVIVISSLGKSDKPSKESE